MKIVSTDSHKPYEEKSSLGPKDKVKEISGVKVLYFYDTSLRLWTCYAVDEMGNQIGETQYANRRADGELDQAIASAALHLYEG